MQRIRLIKQLTAALATAAAAILLLAVALACTSRSAAPQHTAVTAPACGNAHPALPGGAFVWASLPGDGFAGGVGLSATAWAFRRCAGWAGSSHR